MTSFSPQNPPPPRLRSTPGWIGKLAKLGWFVDDRRFAWTWYVLAVLLFSAHSIIRANTYQIAGYDTGIFDQIVRHYAHFDPPMVTLKGDDYNIWGDHFHPIIALWAPLYWIWDNLRVLYIGQALVVAATIFPLWSFVRRRVGSTRWTKVFVLAVMAFWPIQSMIDFEVHEIACALPLLAWIIDGLDRSDDRVLLVCSGLLLLAREDMGTVVFMAGVVRLLLRHLRARDWVVSIGLMVVGLGVFYLVTSVVIPHFASGGFAYWDYPDLGDGPAGALLGALTHPWKVIQLLVYPWDKALTWACLLIPLAFLPLRSPYALLGVPIMASRMLADRWTLWNIHFHYNAPVWIIAALAATDAIGRLRGSADRSSGGSRSRTGRLGLITHPHKVLTAWMTLILIGGLILGMVPGQRIVSSMFPLQRLVTGVAYRMDAQAMARAAAVAWLPANTCVAADDFVAAHLTHTNRVTLPGLSSHEQDFYVLDLDREEPGTTEAMWTTQQSLDHARKLGYKEVFHADSIVIWRSPHYNGPDPLTCGPTTP